MNVSSLLTFTHKVDAAYTAACHSALNAFGLSRTSFDILMFLNNNPDHYTARDIVTFRNIKANVVSLHVDQLVQEGYLERQQVEHDRRKVRLVCTEKAYPILEAGHRIQRSFYEALVDGLTDEDLQTFRHCFCVMGSNAHQLQLGTKGNNGGKSSC